MLINIINSILVGLTFLLSISFGRENDECRSRLITVPSPFNSQSAQVLNDQDREAISRVSPWLNHPNLRDADPLSADFFKRLGLSSEASVEQVKANMRALQMLLHPDRNGDLPENERVLLQEMSKLVNVAYEQLKTEEGRKAYLNGFYESHQTSQSSSQTSGLWTEYEQNILIPKILMFMHMEPGANPMMAGLVNQTKANLVNWIFTNSRIIYHPKVQETLLAMASGQYWTVGTLRVYVLEVIASRPDIEVFRDFTLAKLVAIYQETEGIRLKLMERILSNADYFSNVGEIINQIIASRRWINPVSVDPIYVAIAKYLPHSKNLKNWILTQVEDDQSFAVGGNRSVDLFRGLAEWAPLDMRVQGLLVRTLRNAKASLKLRSISLRNLISQDRFFDLVDDWSEFATRSAGLSISDRFAIVLARPDILRTHSMVRSEMKEDLVRYLSGKNQDGKTLFHSVSAGALHQEIQSLCIEILNLREISSVNVQITLIQMVPQYLDDANNREILKARIDSLLDQGKVVGARQLISLMRGVVRSEVDYFISIGKTHSQIRLDALNILISVKHDPKVRGFAQELLDHSGETSSLVSLVARQILRL